MSKPKRSVNSRAKGARAEREAAKFLTKIGFPCRRTAQVRGKTNGCADIEFEDEKFPIHVEVKHRVGLHLNTLALMKACDQAARECKSGFRPVVMWRERGAWNMTAQVNSDHPDRWATLQQQDIAWGLEVKAIAAGWTRA